MNLDENKRTVMKRILAGVLAVVIFGCGIAFACYMAKGFSDAKAPAATPDNSQFIDSSVEMPDTSNSPVETPVLIAFIAIDVAAVAIILYVLLRKKL